MFTTLILLTTIFLWYKAMQRIITITEINLRMKGPVSNVDNETTACKSNSTNAE
jgi:hypothetical protein